MANIPKVTNEEFVSAGKEVDTIDVQISHRIIQLFSEGLYSSPHKAIEELVSNSFDAYAQNVHVILSPDLTNSRATIVVIDDGEGMDIHALKEHWIIGRSTRRKDSSASGRQPIGKFGIGKLATYVLAEQLTHICKSNGKFFASTMDYAKLGAEIGTIPEFDGNGVFNDEKITIPVRALSERDAQKILETWTASSKPGYKALRLFGNDANDSWTVAIMSRLKPMGRKVQRGRLQWILRTAMPLRDDFKLYLNGNSVTPSKVDFPLVEKWTIGKDIQANTLKSPCPEGLEVTEDETLPEDSEHRFGLSHAQLGRVTGYIELFEGDISTGKSSEIERSNGFFVYIRGRMVNTEDPGFGIPRNLLRHGTFSRFRMVVHIDSLDQALRSSRESLQQGELYNIAKNLLHASFNLARNRLVEHEKSQLPGAIFAARLASAPGSLTRVPLVALAELAIDGKIKPLYTRLPDGLTEITKQDFLQQVQKNIGPDNGIKTELSKLSTEDGLALYDVADNVLKINLSHPFVASFQEFYMKSSSMPLEMYAMTEVLTEAYLYYMEFEENKIRDVLAQRDELLRYFVRSSAKRTAGMIALALSDAKDDEDKLEEEMRAAFEAIGFANVIRIGGKGTPDGTAEAHLAASEKGIVQRYKVGLEAKSGGKVSAKRLGVSGIARHMREFNCDHHVVIGNGFDTSTGDDTASVKEIKELKEKSKLDNKGKTITLMYIDDLARLVRLVPAKRIGLKRLRELFQTCITPEESKGWIDKLSEEQQEKWPHKEILETIWQRANSRPNEAIEYSAVTTALEFRNPPIRMSKQELIDCCKAMQVMAPGVVFARETTVEIERRPDLVLKDIQDTIDEYPEEERQKIII